MRLVPICQSVIVCISVSTRESSYGGEMCRLAHSAAGVCREGPAAASSLYRGLPLLPHRRTDAALEASAGQTTRQLGEGERLT